MTEMPDNPPPESPQEPQPEEAPAQEPQAQEAPPAPEAAAPSLLTKVTIGHAVASAGAVLLILSGPLPWMSFGGVFGGPSGSASGFDMGLIGTLPFVVGIAAAMLIALDVAVGKTAKQITTIAWIAGENAALLAFCGLFGRGASPSIGVFFALVGGLGVMVYYLALQMKDKPWAGVFVRKLK